MATFEELLQQLKDAKIVAAAARAQASNASSNASLVGDKLEVAKQMVRELMEAPPVPPPPASNVVCEFDANDIAIARFRSHVREGLNFRHVNDGSTNRLQSKRNSTQNGIVVKVGSILFPINYMAPEYVEAFKPRQAFLDTFINAKTPNGHSQMRLAGDKLEQGAWTRPEHAYRWEATLDMPASCDWENLAWVLPMQAHPGAYGPDWADPHHRPPAIALYMKRHEWEFWVRGSHEANPTRMMDNWKSDRIPFVPGIQNVSIHFRCDPRSQLSFADCVVNGVRIAAVQQPVGINHSALGAGKPSLNLAMGYYGISPKNLQDKDRKGRVKIISSKLSIIG